MINQLVVILTERVRLGDLLLPVILVRLAISPLLAGPLDGDRDVTLEPVLAGLDQTGEVAEDSSVLGGVIFLWLASVRDCLGL